MSDNDLIRRGDALDCFIGLDRLRDVMDAIAAMPAAPVTLAEALALPEVNRLVMALRVNMTFSEKIADATGIDLDETTVSVSIQPRGETVARMAWADVIGEARAALAALESNHDRT